MSVKSRILSASAIALAIVSMPASALYVGSDVFQGVTFTFTQTSNTAFTLRIQNLLSTTNADWADVTQIGALQWKDLGGDAWTNASTVSGPGVGAYTVTQDKELSSSGCNQGNPPKAICFTFNPLVAASDDITFSFNLVGDIIAIDTTNADETKPRDLTSRRTSWMRRERRLDRCIRSRSTLRRRPHPRLRRAVKARRRRRLRATRFPNLPRRWSSSWPRQFPGARLHASQEAGCLKLQLLGPDGLRKSPAQCGVFSFGGWVNITAASALSRAPMSR